MGQPSKEELDAIVEALHRYPKPTITGAVLGNLIRSAAPTLDIRATVNIPIGPGALSRFVDEFLAHALKRAGRTSSVPLGGDVQYEIIGSNMPRSHPPAVDAPVDDYWNVFVRTSDPRVILVDPSTDGVKLSINSTGPEHGASVIAKVTSRELDEIADEFIANLRLTNRLDLASSLEKATSYPLFIYFLKEAGREQFLEWSVHRRARLRHLFCERLQNAGMGDDQVKLLLAKLDLSQEKSRLEGRDREVQRAVDSTLSSPKPQTGLSVAPEEEEMLRAALKKAIDNMSIQELRALPIKFGVAFDAITSKPRQH